MIPSCLGRDSRLRSAKDFQSVYRFNQVRAKGQYFLVLAFFKFEKMDKKEEKMHQSNRVGAVVSKKVSKLAVRRNTIKRLIKESFRLQPHIVSDFDFIIIAYPNAKNQSNAILRSELDYLWHKVNKRCKSYLLPS